MNYIYMFQVEIHIFCQFQLSIPFLNSNGNDSLELIKVGQL
jgi:hypothetical protein